MDRELIKAFLAELKIVVDGVVQATPGVWDNIVWAGVSRTVLSDAVVDKLLDRLGIKGIVLSQIAPQE